jgi:CheY-like chemotaxis protein
MIDHIPSKGLDLARVLIVDDDPASRLTLQTVLEAGGYQVDAAATAAEAVDKLEHSQYELVLSDLQMESPEAGLKVLAHARMMDYQPATALVQSWQSSALPSEMATGERLVVETEDIDGLLSGVADLISRRALRLLRRSRS